MAALAFRHGLPPSEFWQLTPHLTRQLLMTQEDAAREEYSKLIYLAYHSAALHRVSKLPKLETLLPKKPHTPTREEMIGNFRAFFAGKVAHG